MDKKLLLIQKILSNVDGGSADLWKIYKLMYFIDFEFYSKFGKSISGSDYYHWEYGPMPYKDNTEYSNLNLVEKGIDKGLWRKVDDSNLVQVIPESTLDNAFNQQEELVIFEVLDKYKKLSGKELVDLSHGDMPWKMTKDKEKIDYEFVKWRETEESEVLDITEEVFK